VRLGILGGGQLGRMLALAAHSLGLEPRVYDPGPAASAGDVAPLTVGSFDDRDALAAFADKVDVLTYEFENIDARILEDLAKRGVAFDSWRLLALSQDRLFEKRALAELGIPVVPHRPVDSFADLERARDELGDRLVVKTRRLGYDGRGQRRIRTADDLRSAWDSLGGVPLIAEAFVPFRTEVSLVATRARDGTTVCYPLTENFHEHGILRLSRVPLRALLETLVPTAEDYVRRLAERHDYVGTLSVEFFVTDGGLVANEIAPRVHNSGHWTIDGAVTSQFANHVRAVVGYPLGSPRPHGHAAMVNCVGGLPDPASVLALPGAQLHDYRKEPRPGRKLGHVTLVGEEPYETDREPLKTLLALTPFLVDPTQADRADGRETPPRA
jgi:5-(carboxyamino)imidazole ribonucleotide synthase